MWASGSILTWFCFFSVSPVYRYSSTGEVHCISHQCLCANEQEAAQGKILSIKAFEIMPSMHAVTIERAYQV